MARLLSDEATSVGLDDCFKPSSIAGFVVSPVVLPVGLKVRGVTPAYFLQPVAVSARVNANANSITLQGLFSFILFGSFLSRAI